MRSLLFLCATLFALPAASAPTYVDVTGVAANDTLNVRAAPDAKSEDIGDLPPDATGIEIGAVDETGAWGRIIWHEGNGWISLAFTTPSPLASLPGTTIPTGLLCIGTEPFWSARFTGSSVVMSSMEATQSTARHADTLHASGRTWPQTLIYVGQSAVIATLRPLDCSDTMSDRTYPWTTDMLLQDPTGRTLLSGCCYLPFDAGQN